MKKFVLLLVIFALPLFAYNLLAQKPTVKARLDSTVLRIGDQTKLIFEISQKPNQRVQTPLFSDTIIDGLELVEPLKLDTLEGKDGNITVRHNYVVTAFNDSLFYIPPFPFVVNGDTTWSKSLSLKVIQPFKIDTASNTIADIKPVMNPKFNWLSLIKWFLLINVILAILGVLFLIIRKYWQKKPIFEQAPEVVLPPDIIAIERLDKLKLEKPWHHGRSKEYHTELTDIVRAYIEKVFEIQSLEMTSDEILEHLEELKYEQKEVYNALRQILKLADLVKFAKWNPTPDEHELSLSNSYLFVNKTRPENTESEQGKTEEKKTK